MSPKNDTVRHYVVLSWPNVFYLRTLFSCCSGCAARKRKVHVKDILQMIVMLLDGGNEENDKKYQPKYLRVGPKQFSTDFIVVLKPCNLYLLYVYIPTKLHLNLLN